MNERKGQFRVENLPIGTYLGRWALAANIQTHCSLVNCITRQTAATNDWVDRTVAAAIQMQQNDGVSFLLGLAHYCCTCYLGNFVKQTKGSCGSGTTQLISFTSLHTQVWTLFKSERCVFLFSVMKCDYCCWCCPALLVGWWWCRWCPPK